AFARPPEGLTLDGAVQVITTNRGLVSPSLHVTRTALLRFGEGDIAADDAVYRRALLKSARALDSAAPDSEVVLLGSIASGKYADLLGEVFGERLFFPVDFVGRGDMSRGGLMLRAVREGRELPYAPVLGAVRHGKRPPKLTPVRRDPLR
ncbi:MAG: hypothetical protein ACK4N5_20080, partial [Myxococcales bacterium]